MLVYLIAVWCFRHLLRLVANTDIVGVIWYIFPVLETKKNLAILAQTRESEAVLRLYL
jgi:hypothetical protein